VLPAHEVYQVLVDIWSGGCNPQLHYALPILFALEISGLCFGALGVHRRAHYAVVKEEADKEALQMRVDTAVGIVREREERERKEHAARSSTEIHGADEKQADDREERKEEEEEEEAEEREGLEETIRRQDTNIKRVQSKATGGVNFGPSFGFAFGSNDES
jgi:hypothetical protein